MNRFYYVIIALSLVTLSQVQTLYKSLAFCNSNSSCSAPKDGTINDVCCGYAEYERNGILGQFVPKCLEIAKFEDYYNEISALPNIYVDNVALGCFAWDVDNGFSLNEYSYTGEEDEATTGSSFATVIATKLTAFAILALSFILY